MTAYQCKPMNDRVLVLVYCFPKYMWSLNGSKPRQIMIYGHQNTEPTFNYRKKKLNCFYKVQLEFSVFKPNFIDIYNFLSPVGHGNNVEKQRKC